jgi:hypothetical protein
MFTMGAMITASTRPSMRYVAARPTPRHGYNPWEDNRGAGRVPLLLWADRTSRRVTRTLLSSA